MRRSTRLRSGLMAGFAALALVAAPMAADARPGGGMSSGSRGSRSYSAPPSTNTAPSGATRFDRTEAPRQGTQAQPGFGNRAATPARGGFMGGLMGGLLGAGLIGMLFGAGLFGGLSGLAGMLGLLLQLALIAGLAFLAVRLFRGRRTPAMAGNAPGVLNRDGGAGMGGLMARMGGGAATATRPVQVGPNDFQAFERTLVEVNEAWSRGDVDALRRMGTPEMARYFENDLRDLAARQWRNQTSDVRLESGDLSEAWNENGQDFATVAMRFSLIDVTRDAAGRVVEGSPTERQTTTELWTFTRRPATGWTLSAIQQTR